MDRSSHQTLVSTIKTDTGLLTVPVSELRLVLQQPDKFGGTAVFFRHPTDRAKAGRLKVTFGKMSAGQSAALKSECPNLYSLLEAYKAHCKSYVMMLTWAGGLWLHVDLRAIESVKHGGHFSGYKAAKAVGSPRDSIITLHTVSGEGTLLQYAAVPNLDTASTAVLSPKLDPTKHICESFLRETGQMQAVGSWVQCGHAVAERDEDGVLLVKRRETPEEIGATLFHSAGANGPGASVSVFGTCEHEPDRVSLCETLRQLEVERVQHRRLRDSIERTESARLEQASDSKFLLWGGPFHASIPDKFSLADNSDGTGGQGVDVHAAKIKAGLQKSVQTREAGMRGDEIILRPATASENEVISKYIEAPYPCLRLAASPSLSRRASPSPALAALLYHRLGPCRFETTRRRAA